MEINATWLKKGDITTDTTEAQRLTRDCEQQYSNKFDNLEQMDKLLYTNTIPRTNCGKKKKTEYLNKSVTNNMTKSVIKKFLIKQSQVPQGITAEFYQVFKEYTFLKLVPKIKKIPNWLHKASITLILQTDKDRQIYTCAYYRPISDEHKHSPNTSN